MSEEHGSYPSLKAGYYITAVLFFTNVVGYLDRLILSLLVEPIKVSLQLSDGEIGLMQGLAFVLTFSIAGIFIGSLVDRTNRQRLLLICLAIWTICAAAGGLAQNGTQLFIARMGVGIGEAALIPTAISMISDAFDNDRRGKAYGLFTTGVYAGSGLSLLLVALLLAPATHVASILAEHYGIILEPWRIVMLSTLIPGFICLALLLTLRDPPRHQPPSPDRMQGVRDWRADRGFLALHHLGYGLVTFGTFALSAWLPTVLVREYGLDARTAGLTFGPVVLVAGVAGAFLGGVLSDFGSRRDGVRGRMKMGAMCLVMGTSGFLLIGLGGSTSLVVAGGGIVTGGIGAAIVSGIMAMSDRVPGRSRGLISAIYFLVTGLVGAAGGPAVVGFVNDRFGASQALSQSLSITCAMTCAAALLILGAAIARLTRAEGHL